MSVDWRKKKLEPVCDKCGKPLQGMCNYGLRAGEHVLLWYRFFCDNKKCRRYIFFGNKKCRRYGLRSYYFADKEILTRFINGLL